MATTPLRVKQGDVGYPVRSQLISDGAVVDLTGATARFIMRATKTSAAAKVDQPATIVGDPAQGNIQYEMTAGDLDTPGNYLVEWEVTFATGEVATWPSGGYLPLTVVAELG